jgi:ABC-type branched-subunit amino acid transport system ATPase component
MNSDLVVNNLIVRFGGLTAVNDLTLQACSATITGLIGPNGAGKTTTFNAIAGNVSVAAGSVCLGERQLDSLDTAARVQCGLGRTFQIMELFNSMTVAENVAMGPEIHFAGRRPWRHLMATRNEKLTCHRLADSAMAQCGIEGLAGRYVADLSTGDRRLVELARAIASPSTMLLLDEPSSGLDVQETDRFAKILIDVVSSSGRGILLVEHDMALVRAVCTYIYVLDFGILLYEGLTKDVLDSKVVRDAYLGSDTVMADG